jgi:hypothetical protein
METFINLWENFKSHTNQQIQIEDWLALIKNSPHTNQIEAARLLGKSNPIYKTIKESLPAATLNFSFHNSRKNSDICCSTGFFYIDFDTQSKEEAESLKLDLSNNPHIYAAWLSLSQLGIGALIKVEGITLDNFRESYKEITQELGIEFDPMAVKATQANVISSDPQIYINTNSVPKKVSSINNKTTTTILYLEDTFLPEFEIPEFVITESNRVRFNLKVTLPTYNSDCDYYPKGLPYFEAYWPYSHKGQHSRIFSGRRHSTITTFANNLIILNPTVSLEQVVSWIHSFNKSYCVEPFTYKEVYKIVEEKYKLRETLQPIGIKLKKFWVNPNSINKKQAFLNCKSVSTKAHSLSLIQDFIGLELYNTTSKVTLQTIANYTGLSLITIKRNITKELQSLIKEHNQSLKKVSSINNSKLKTIL